MLFGMAFLKCSTLVKVSLVFYFTRIYTWIVRYLIRFSREFITADFKRIQIWPRRCGEAKKNAIATITTVTLIMQRQRNKENERERENEKIVHILLLFR